jgi:H+-transporting ATPase
MQNINKKSAEKPADESKNAGGLSTAEARKLLAQYGRNVVAAAKGSWAKKYLAPLVSPINLMLLAAAVLSFVNRDVMDAWFIFALYFLNYFIEKFQEHKADTAIAKLQSSLAVSVKTRRDGKLLDIDSALLVPGDVIELGLGAIVPADAEVVAGENLSVNESALTGESLPVEKKAGMTIFSGTFIATGAVTARVTATGSRTRFGRTILGIDARGEKSVLEKDILAISKLLSGLAIAAVVILSIFFLVRGESWTRLLTLDLSLLIAGVPIALPAVMTIILSLGAVNLAKKHVIVRRLSALEDLSNVNLLLTDKTGTLTTNRISVARAVSYYKDLTDADIIALANFAAAEATPDAIDSAVHAAAKSARGATGATSAKIVDYLPYDGDRKRSTVAVDFDDSALHAKLYKVLGAAAGSAKITTIATGAPQVLGRLSRHDLAAFENDIKKAADDGFRTLAVAVADGKLNEKNMRLVGLLYLADPLDPSSRPTIKFMHDEGIHIKMVTGDNARIAARVSNDLGLTGGVLTRDELGTKHYDEPKEFVKISAFAEIDPSDKEKLVSIYQRHKFVVASTGDGVNDLPALKTANIGIAVAGAVDALKAAADLVLLKRGISVIKTAIVEARAIFVRLYNYSVYRISESTRLIVTILVLGIAIGTYPLDPLQLILLAFMNDIPIISLATDRVRAARRPDSINQSERRRYALSYGFIGVASSLLMFFLLYSVFHLPLDIIKTAFFLKLTVSGHLLIYVAHTKERWWRWLPSKSVIGATLGTQAVATMLALTGWLMSSPISWALVGFVWLWSIVWMQISEFGKWIIQKFFDPEMRPGAKTKYGKIVE